MFPPISAIFSLLFFASTLPNGIRLVELPAAVETVEIVAGYTSGGLAGFTSTAAAKSLLLEAYAAGGNVELVDELDRTALRMRAPKWALPMLMSRLPALFKEVPMEDEGAAPAFPGFRTRVEEEIRSALVGPSAPALPYATGDAFILISGPFPNALREALAAIPKRGSASKPEEVLNRLPAERTLRFKSDLPEGAIVFASPIPGVYYKQWYLVLLLDRLIRRIVPLPLKTTLPLAVRPYYYRLELAVPAGQFPEQAEENLLQEIERLQFAPANLRDLNAARQETLAYLDSKSVREWFASHDVLSRREEGVEWIQSMSADDMRVAARDLLIMNRVIATWAPKPRQTSVTVEQLRPPEIEGRGRIRSDRSQAAGLQLTERNPVLREGGDSVFPAFPAHTDPALSTLLPEQLSSGVSLVASNANAVFIRGGGITRFDRELTPEDLKPFQQYRPDRILVLSPATSMDRSRQLWSVFRGATTGETGTAKGKVSSGDLSALLILKTVLDLKVMESGWWPEVSLSIDATAGSDLQIHAAEEKRSQILDWIKAAASTIPGDAYFAWVREIAIHRFDSVRVDVQALIWERDPQGTVQDLETVSAKHVQDVARIYF